MDPRLRIDLRHRLTRLELDVRVEVGAEVLGLVGPSAAGKTTLLRAVAGLVRPERGRIFVSGRTVLDTRAGIDVPPELRRVGLVFQEGALFPHMTVLGNVSYGARRLASGRKETRRRALEVMERFGIAHLGPATVTELSGGERQRVALARTVAAGPDVLLLDEPLSAVDAATRGRISSELAVHLEALGLPTVLVSHSFPDVAGLASRIAVMENGRIVQAGTPAELVQAPSSEFVAAMTGVNFLAGTARPRRGLTEVEVRHDLRVLTTDHGMGQVGVVLYPWDVAISLDPPAGSALNSLRGPVRRVVAVGNRLRVTVGTDPAVVAEITEESARHLALAPGVQVVASWKATATRLVPLH